ncbi:hypothetical protein AB0L40_26735 [Patulibacter sp. NPDC049589]|uniref:hypothetical protein n=1 Tax=Patulibacter sp. NPDC049589 TaxID=3154731 RepID=UPI00343678C2
MFGLLKILAVIAVLFFGGRFLVDRYAHGDSWRTADGTTECRTKLGGTIQTRRVVAPGAKAADWKGADEAVTKVCDSAKPN